MTGFSITILFGGLVSTLRELMSPYKLNKIFIGGLVTGWRGLMSTYTEILCRGGPVTTSPPALSVVPVSTTAGLIRNRVDSVPSRSRTNSENAGVFTPTHDSRPSSVIYGREGISTSPPMTVKSNANSFSMNDMEPSLHPVNNYIRTRLSHTATPENSLPKPC